MEVFLLEVLQYKRLKLVLKLKKHRQIVQIKDLNYFFEAHIEIRKPSNYEKYRGLN